jgi:hypothetical protein
VSVTGTTNFAPVIGKGEGDLKLFCYVSQAGYVVVVFGVGKEEITRDTGTDGFDDASLSYVIPVNIAVIDATA